jgi:hypothetical protein
MFLVFFFKKLTSVGYSQPMEVKVRLTSIGQGPTEDKVKPMKKGFFRGF